MMRKWTIAMMALAVGLSACDLMPARGDAASSPESQGAGQLTDAGQKAKVFTDLSAAYFQRRQFKVALQEVRKAIIEDNRYGPAYNVLGLIYMELDEDQLAEENFRKAVDLDRADSEAHNNYGWFLCTRGRYDEGLSQFTDALRNPLYSTPEKSMANAGLCHEKKGDLDKAEASFIKAMKLQPDYPLALLSMAKLKFRQAKLEESARLLSHYHEVAPASAESLWLGVRLERKLGDKDQQAAFAVQLHKTFPESREDNLMTSGQYE
jgi:type IV pilus assembly protein PilF